MTERNVDSFLDLLGVLRRRRTERGWVYRGQSDSSWPLRPKAGRPPFDVLNDSHAFDYWRFSAAEHMTDPPEDDWHWLATAQHYGLATRLLDWSYSPLVGVYFAVREEKDEDAAVFALHIGNPPEAENGTAMKFDGVALFTPKRKVPRISRQAGAFTIHGPPTLALEDAVVPEARLEKLIIPKDKRSEVVEELDYLYVHESRLFPDLDGLSRYVNRRWEQGRLG